MRQRVGSRLERHPIAARASLPDRSVERALFAAGVEQSIYVEALTGLHPDGSLRSVLVQSNYNLGSTPVNGEFIVGMPRTAPALAQPNAPRATPAAVALPTDPNYLVSTELSGPMLTAAASAALGPTYVKYDQDFATYADYHWGIEGSQWENDYYDRALIYYVMWARTGNPVYWYRGTQFAYSYRENYLRIAVETYGGAQPYQVQLEGIEKHYILTGDTLSRHVVVGQMEDSIELSGSISKTLRAAPVVTRIRMIVLGRVSSWDFSWHGGSTRTGKRDSITITIPSRRSSTQTFSPPFRPGCFERKTRIPAATSPSARRS